MQAKKESKHRSEKTMKTIREWVDTGYYCISRLFRVILMVVIVCHCFGQQSDVTPWLILALRKSLEKVFGADCFI